MGQTPSNPTIATPSITRYSPKYHVVETKQDPHYGEVKIIVEDETKERQILKEISFTSQAAFDKELDFFTQRVQVSDPNIAGILGFSSENDNNVSPHLFTIKIFIELVDKDLQQELQERIQANKFFSESELLFICEGIISALYHLERQGFSHGDIRPFNIFASPKGYKLFDPSLSSQRNHNGFIKALKNDLQAFLCPELLAQVPERDQEIKCNKFRADVFSLGVTILSLASLTHGEDLYNYQTGVIKNKLLQDRLDIVKHHYSMFTHDLIKDMLTEEESERPNFKALHTKLLPYQDNIRQKTDLPFFKKKQNLSQDKTESSVPKEELPEKTESTDLTKTEEVPKDPISGHQVEYTRKPTGSEPEEHIKPGGIIIDPEDALPSKRGELYKGTSKHNEEYYYQYLHPKAGVINVVVENEPNRDQEKPLKSKAEKPEQFEGPVREFDYQKTRVLDKENVKMGGSYKNSEDILLTKEEKDKLIKEHSANQREVVRTGSILIDPEDVLPSMRESIHTDSRTGATYANLKSDAQIREEQRGIVHASGPHEVEKRSESGMTQTKREPMRTGSILIDPEDALPSMRESIHTDPRTGATYANLKSDAQIREGQGGIVHAGVQQEMEKRSGNGTSQTKREPMRMGSILIDPEDVLPSMRESIHTDPRTGATYADLKSDAQIREGQGGIVHARGPQEVEKRGGMTRNKREPIRSGSILIDPEDVLPSMRINVHRDPRTGETYANLKSDTQIREEQGGIVHAREPIQGEQIKSSFSRNIDTSKTFSRQFSYEFTREMPYEDPIKTGGIIIRKEDALPYMKDNVHTDPHSGETYAMLKPWTQIKEEQAGATHLVGSSSEENREEEKRAEPVLETRSEIKAGQEVDDKKTSRVHTRQFIIECERAVQEEDPFKTGGIVIDPEDALPMHRSEIRTDPRSHLSVARLKPWSQIQKEQAGIIHQGPLQEAREQQEKPKSSKRRRESVREEDRLINPEENQAMGRDSVDKSQCEIAHGSNQPKSEVTRTREFDFVYTRTVQAEHIKRGQPTRFIEPENMLTWMNNEPEVQGLISRSQQEVQPRHHREPIKTGSILIKPEDVLPTEIDKLHTDPKTGETYANLKSDFEIREQQGGIVHAPEPQTVERESQMIDIARDPRVAEEKKSSQSSVRLQGSRNFYYEYEPLKARSQEEPIKTGGIVINRDDALPAHRESVLKDPHSRVTYVALKPWTQIQKEQDGVVHSSSIHHKASDDVLMKESSRVQRRHKRENTSEQWKNNENKPIRRPENIISQDKENISTVANFKKSSHAQGEFSKSYSIPLDEAGLGGENADSDKQYFTKQAEDRSKWVHLNDKVDTMLRNSRVILGESVLNTTPNVI